MATYGEEDDSDHFHDALDEINEVQKEQRKPSSIDMEPNVTTSVDSSPSKISSEFEVLKLQDSDVDENDSDSEESNSDTLEHFVSADGDLTNSSNEETHRKWDTSNHDDNLNAAGDGLDVHSDETADKESEEIKIDEEEIRQKEALLSPEEIEDRRSRAQGMKEGGNTDFKAGNFNDAIEKFTGALTMCPMCFEKERSIMYSNRAASKYRLENYENCIADCSKALVLNPHYLKALLRRAECYEKTEKLDEAMEDYTKALEMDPSLLKAREACMRLPGEINERNEKMKAEMMDKLKDLGNMVLRPFGLSTNNFKMNQDPNTGSYSMNFVQSP